METSYSELPPSVSLKKIGRDRTFVFTVVPIHPSFREGRGSKGPSEDLWESLRGLKTHHYKRRTHQSSPLPSNGLSVLNVLLG